MSLAEIGEYQQAIAELESATRLADIPLIVASLAHAHAVSGNRDASLELLDKLKELAKVRDVDPYHFAIIHCGLGMISEALHDLHQAVEVQSAQVNKALGDPRIDVLRPYPGFRDVFATTGAAPYIGFQDSFKSR